MDPNNGNFFGQHQYIYSLLTDNDSEPAPVVLLVLVWLAMVIVESGFEARVGRIIVSGYSGVCFEIKFSGMHRGFDGVLFKSVTVG